MKIYTCLHSGLCSGAKEAYDTTCQYASENLYMYGEILHNPMVISQLKEKGVKVIHTLNEVKYLPNKDKITVLIRAHGVSKAVIDELNSSHIKYIDKTCIEVIRSHNIVYEKSQQGYTVIVVGKNSHPEVIGTIGWACNDAIVLANIEETKTFIQHANPEAKYCIVGQTTFNYEKYKEITDYCKMHLKHAEVFNTICMDIEYRQQELQRLSETADAVIVIGGKKSFNSNKLYEIAKNKCLNVQLIESYKELDFSGLNENSYVVLASGASTPDSLILEVKKKLREFEHDMRSILL